MSTGDRADLFAIPDFWKLSSLQQPPSSLAANEQQDDFFRLDVDNSEPLAFFPGKVEPEEQCPPDVFFQIPDLLGQLHAESSQEATGGPAADDGGESQAPVPSPDWVEDFWLEASDEPALAAPAYETWEAFEHAGLPHATPLVATELGPAFVDACVSSADGPLGLAAAAGPPTTTLLDARAYGNCLLSLALGRNSVLFSWDDSKHCFRPLWQPTRVSGYTEGVLRSLECTVLACGTNSRFLRAVVEQTYTAAAAPAMASRVALAKAIDSLLLVMQRELGARAQTPHAQASLLQLQALIRPVASVVQYCRQLVTRLVPSAAAGDDDESRLLSLLFHEAQAMEHSVVLPMRDIMRQFLQAVAEPWIQFAMAWLGLAPHSKSVLWTGQFRSKGFVRVGARVWVDDMGAELAEQDYFLDPDKMPAFLPPDIAQALFETGRNIRFLWTNHPDHPLSDAATLRRACPPRMAWHFDWEAISATERKTLAFEKTVCQMLAAARQTTPAVASSRQPTNSHQALPSRGPDLGWHWNTPELRIFGQDEKQMEQSIEASMARLDAPVSVPVTEKDGLDRVLCQRLFDDGDDGAAAHQRLEDDRFVPHWSLLPLLSFGPLVSAQSRLVSRECTRLLFSAHELRKHLRLQRDFQLLGNGMFCSRLSHALFDPDLAGAEKKTGVELSSGQLGLRLANRDNWPPASSELRLALMGVLAESYFQADGDQETKMGAAGIGGEGSARRRQHELPGNMSFAVRDLSVEEMDRCMDPHGLEALDFLRLSYKPPSALMSVLTPTILAKYDRIFKSLLRVLRMYYVVNQLVHEARPRTAAAVNTHHGQAAAAESGTVVATRFRFEAHHLVANIMAYFLDLGVGRPWTSFEAWLGRVQDGLEQNSAAASAAADTSPDQLRQRHEQVLDDIMQALFLRKRQQPLFQLLEDIFRIILEFAKASSSRSRRRPSRAPMAAAAATAQDDGADELAQAKKVRQLYVAFRKKVGVFLTVCRGLAEKMADSMARKDEGQQREDDSLVGRLLLMLDYNGSFSAAPGRG